MLDLFLKIVTKNISNRKCIAKIQIPLQNQFLVIIKLTYTAIKQAEKP